MYVKSDEIDSKFMENSTFPLFAKRDKTNPYGTKGKPAFPDAKKALQKTIYNKWELMVDDVNLGVYNIN